MIANMPRVADVLLLFVVTSLQACSSPKPDSKSPQSQPAAESVVHTDFEEFVVLAFNWELDGYDVLRVKKSGDVTLVVAVMESIKIEGERVIAPVWYRLDWKTSNAKLQELVDKLEAIQFRDLDTLYIDRDVDDGQNVTFLFTNSRGTNRVTCSNEFPKDIQALRTLLAKNFTRQHQSQIKGKGKRLSEAESEAFWKPYEDKL